MSQLEKQPIFAANGPSAHTTTGGEPARALLKDVVTLGAPQEQLLSVLLDLPALEDETRACREAFRFELPIDLEAALQGLQQVVGELMSLSRCELLVLDEKSGLYQALNGFQLAGIAPQSLASLAEDSLQAFMQTDQPVMHCHLSLENNDIGLVVVSGKRHRNDFTSADHQRLAVLAPFLAQKVSRFLQLRQAQTAPYIQGMVLAVAEKLVTAVDQDGIMTTLLDTFAGALGFDACQFVGFNPDSGVGEVLYEIRKTAGQSRPAVQSYSHAGLQGKRRPIREYTNLVGLLSSMARNRFYLNLNGKKLGERSLGEIFGIRNIQAALLLPVVDLATGEVRGTFNLFRTQDGAVISDESREIARATVQLASQALSRAAVLEKALAMASSDELTGLINRRGFYQRFEAELERARRHQTPLCVALVDVDHFKRLNDTYGHLSGDVALKALAEALTHNVRKSDVVCRFGGEEFALLLPDTALQSATELLERVRHNVAALPLRGQNGEPLQVTISVGLTTVNIQHQSPQGHLHRSEISEALAEADTQLYAAKRNGRNQVRAASPERQDWCQTG